MEDLTRQYVKKILFEEAQNPNMHLQQVQAKIGALAEEIVQLLSANPELTQVHQDGTATLDLPNGSRVTSSGPIERTNQQFIRWKDVLEGIFIQVERELRSSSLPAEEQAQIINALRAARTQLERENVHTRTTGRNRFTQQISMR
jgi:hypothetical protein